jgi:hypothetical protein
MDATKRSGESPRDCSGFSVVFAEKVLQTAKALGVVDEWSELTLGHVSRRISSYRPAHRIAALLAGLACGLRGIAPGNSLLRTNSALKLWTGGTFPDQGTIHRWLNGCTSAQAEALRRHLRQVMVKQGRFWNVLYSGRRLFVDVDAQGLVARGARFEKACRGYMDGRLDRGYQRFVAYVGDTHEVLDEFLRPGNTMLTGELKTIVEALNEIFSVEDRARVVVRADAHGGTRTNVETLQNAGYSYLCRMMSRSGLLRLRESVASIAGQQLVWSDAKDNAPVECWNLPCWTIHGRRRKQAPVHSRVVLYRANEPKDGTFWMALLIQGVEGTPEELWTKYHDRGGTIEEYNDQSERAFHLEVMRTGSYAGLNVLHALMALCWNLDVWALEELKLPPTQSPGAACERWIPAVSFDRIQVVARSVRCGLLLYRDQARPPLEVEDTVNSVESHAWLNWLNAPIQKRLHMAA